MNNYEDDFYEGIAGVSLFDKLYLGHLKERRIVLNEEIESSLIETAVMPIKQFNIEDEANNIPVDQRKPIYVYINSGGGSVYDGFALVGAIKSSKTPVVTHVDGHVMSMAFAIYLAGHRRTATPYANFMYHEVSTGSYGKNQEIERVTQENKRIQKMYDGLVIEQTDITQKKLDAIRKSLKDWFFDVHEALELGVVHEII